jgi:hypothetical protein
MKPKTNNKENVLEWKEETSNHIISVPPTDRNVLDQVADYSSRSINVFCPE